MSFSDNLKGLFKKKRRLDALFIDEAGQLHKKEVKYENNTFLVKGFSKEPQAYIVDQRKMLYDSKNHKPVSLYYVNNPNPLTVEHTRNAQVDSIGFREILESKTIKDLFSEEGQKTMKILLILMCVVIGLNILLLLISFGVIKVKAAVSGGTP